MFSPIQRQSGHQNIISTNDPNPLFPFKFFNGAPVVGALVSPALREREKVQGPFNDPAIQAARLRADMACRSVKLVLPPAAAAKSMEKMKWDFAVQVVLYRIDQIIQTPMVSGTQSSRLF